MEGTQPTTSSLIDRQGRIVADVLSHFKNLVRLAATSQIISEGDSATKEVAASQGLEMEVETAGLVRAAEELLQLTRELKELWLFGPIRGIGEGEGEGKIDEDAEVVGELAEAILRKDTDIPGNLAAKSETKAGGGA